MSPEDVMILSRSALMVVLVTAGPLLLTSLVIGVFIGLLQALTQIQEMTLTFVPKIIAMGLVLLMTLPMMGAAMSDFMHEVETRIITPPQ